MPARSSFICRMLFALLALICGGPLGAATTTTLHRRAYPEGSLSAELEALRIKYELPALAIAASTQGQLHFSEAVGIRRLLHPEEVTSDDRFHIGSCTKAMTATLIARQVERGSLRWDLPLQEAFPELAETMHAGYRTVTLEQLLNHTGGLPANPTAAGIWPRLFDWKGTTTSAREKVAEVVQTRKPAAKAGAEFLYSNTGYMIAGLIAERATKTPWEDLMATEVFTPLGITTAGFGTPGTPNQTDQPWGHSPGLFFGQSATQQDNPPALGPAGTVHLTLADWARFATLHATKGASVPGYLKPETFDRLHRAALDEYALGWGVVGERKWARGVALSHSGSNTAWYAVVWISPQTGGVYLAATNTGKREAPVALDEAIGLAIRRAGAAAGS